MLGKGFERLELNDIKSENSIKQRVFQKLFFGEIIFDNDFFDIEKIADTDISFLNVKQLDQNTRVVIIGCYLYKFTPDNPIYNYIDNGRAIFCNDYNCFIFNDLDISRDDLIIVDKWQNDKREFYFRQIWETKCKDKYYNSDNIVKVYLLFKEDIEGIKTELYREEELRKHEEIEVRKERQIKNLEVKEQERKTKEMKSKYMTLSRIEDKDIIIEDNYFIEKNKGLKIIFDKKIIDIFNKEDLISDYGYNNEDFINLCYESFLRKLIDIYYIGKYETPLAEKINKLNKNLLHFKVYDYNLETKIEEFLAEIKIENKFIKDKYKFCINGIKIPSGKMAFVFRFLGVSYSLNIEVLKNRLKNLNITLQQVKTYSGTQLELLKGKYFKITYNNIEIPLQFEISNPDFSKENWQISFMGLKVSKTYNEIKQAVYYRNHSDIVNAITQISEFLGNNVEDKIIDYVKIYIEKRKQAEQKAKQLFLDFIEKNKSRVIPKDDFWIIKGKLKNYKLAFKNDNDVGVWTYPNNNYVCINERDKAGQELVGYDKLIQFALVLMNDSNLREEVTTLDR